MKRKVWAVIYEAWKQANPEIATDEFKDYRRKLVRGCVGKTPHETYGEAVAIVAELPLRPGRVLHAYECPICKKFHVGNTSANGKLKYGATMKPLLTALILLCAFLYGRHINLTAPSTPLMRFSMR